MDARFFSPCIISWHLAVALEIPGTPVALLQQVQSEHSNLQQMDTFLLSGTLLVSASIAFLLYHPGIGGSVSDSDLKRSLLLVLVTT